MKKLHKYKIQFIIFICFFVSYLIFYPGTMTTDSITQFQQAVSHSYSDWHPPLMSFLWSKVMALGVHSAPFLVVQLAFFWYSVLLIYQRYIYHKYAWIIILLPICPWILNFMGVLWKDVQFAYALLLLVALSLRINSKSQHTNIIKVMVFIIQILLFFYALNLRHNSVFALVPVGYLLFYMWIPRVGKFSLLLYSCILIIVSFTIGKFVNEHILNVEKTHPEYYVMIDDLYHLSLERGQSLIPNISYNQIKQCEYNSPSFIQNDRLGKSFCLYPLENGILRFPEIPNLSNIWLKEILNNKKSYLEYKLSSFMFLIRLSDRTPFYIWSGTQQNLFEAYSINRLLNNEVDNYIYNASQALPILFLPVFWIIIIIGLITYLIRYVRPFNQEVYVVNLSLNISALVYISTYFLMTTGADFRYVYWSILAISLSLVLVFFEQETISHRDQKK